jgi:hypothetical protein
MAVRTAHTPGPVSWTGWSANLRATARISSGETLGGARAEQEDWSLGAVFGVTAWSVDGSGAIAGPRRRVPGARFVSVVAGRERRKLEKRRGTAAPPSPVRPGGINAGGFARAKEGPLDGLQSRPLRCVLKKEPDGGSATAVFCVLYFKSCKSFFFLRNIVQI